MQTPLLQTLRAEVPRFVETSYFLGLVALATINEGGTLNPHELAREVLRRTGPMAVSSANHSGQPAALTCDEAIDQLGDAVSVYLDGGELAASGGAPSTIVDFTRSDEGEILRVGALSVAEIEETLPDVVDLTAKRDEPTVEAAESEDG